MGVTQRGDFESPAPVSAARERLAAWLDEKTRTRRGDRWLWASDEFTKAVDELESLADEVARQHMLDAHREQVEGFAELLAGNPPTPLPVPLWTATDADHRAHLIDDGDRVRLVIEDRTGRRMSVRLAVEALRRGYEATGRHLTAQLGRNVDDEWRAGS